MSTQAQIGSVVTFIASGDSDVTEAGIVVGHPSSTEVLVAYDFAVLGSDQIAHCKEFVTDSATTVSNLVD